MNKPLGNTEMEDIKSNIIIIEKDLIGMHHVLKSQGTILEELKDVVVQQGKTIQQVSLLQAELGTLNKDLYKHLKDYEVRKEISNKYAQNVDAFLNKIKGGLRVTLVVLGIVQGSIGAYLIYHHQDIKELRDNTLILKERVNNLELRLNKKEQLPR